MRLEVTQTGGFGGLVRHWSAEIPDIECNPLLAALSAVAAGEHNRPDERTYEIQLGSTAASVPEHRIRQGILAVLIERAQHGDLDR